METTLPQDHSSPDVQEKPGGMFPIVGLGASAGGLQALQEFFERMPAENGMAFVVILHLSPDHESHAAEILQRSTQMSVLQVVERVKVEPNQVYVIPPSKHLSMVDGHIVLSAAERTRGRNVAIDLFFRTLAAAHTRQAACVVLSGTGADGSIGLKHIKEHGGFCLTQDPQQAEYDEMPRNAINTGMVDFVLPAAEMPAKLIEIWQNSNQIQLPEEAVPIIIDSKQKAGNALREVLRLLRTRTGHDFTHYKQATVLRRIERRLQVTLQPDLPTYSEYLREHAPEAKLLLKDLLISVTNFFRDPKAWEALEREVIPQLFADKKAGDTVRVWVAGCATGEEAYSLAILLLEYARLMPEPPQIQVFATDIDEDAIATAREGIYPTTIEADVSAERLHAFFRREAGGYQIHKEVRERVLFANHNLIKDPPFSRLDLASCRNLLIYLTSDIQKWVFEVFYFALRPDGYLFLGNSESPEGAAGVFTTLDKKHRLFRASTGELRKPPVPDLPREVPGGQPRAPILQAVESKRLASSELHRQFLEQYAPPSVIVNSDYDLVHVSQHAVRYLQIHEGEPSLNLLQVILPELRGELRPALFQAGHQEKNVEANRVSLQREGRQISLRMMARPVQHAETGKNYILVLFQEGDDVSGAQGQETTTVQQEPILQGLEAELQQLKRELRTTIEQYETTVEELKSANEELQSTNEELRSTGEELETSKEEMQSMNEELRTVNDELKHKIEQLTISNSDLRNLMDATQIATIFLDRNLRIKRYTSGVQEVVSVIPTDAGRLLTDLAHKLKYEKLVDDAEEVLKTLQTIEREVSTTDNRTFLLRLMPYRTLEDKINGVVITFIDITERRQAEEAKLFLASIVESSQDSIITMNFDGKITSWNDAAEELYGYSAAEAIGKPLTMLTLPEDLQAVLGDTEKVKHSETVEKFDSIRIHKGGRQMTLEVVLSPVNDASGRIIGVSTIARDVTESRQAGEQQQRSQEELERRVEEQTRDLRTEMSRRQQTEDERQQLLHRLVEMQEDERRRISRELHDSLGQQLTVLRMRLENLPVEDTASYQRQARELKELVKQLDAEVDFLAWELRPSVLDHFGLVPAIRKFLEDWSRHFSVKSQFHSRGTTELRFPTEVETHLYRILQEALNNISKHAGAGRVSVSLAYQDQSLTLIIEDDGDGFDLAATQALQAQDRGLGLIGMRERATLIGATLDIESTIGSGTTIYVHVPLSEPPKLGERLEAD